jgi:hypothetical protein
MVKRKNEFSPLTGATLQTIGKSYLAIMLLGYALLTQVVKTWFIRRFGE